MKINPWCHGQKLMKTTKQTICTKEQKLHIFHILMCVYALCLYLCICICIMCIFVYVYAFSIKWKKKSFKWNPIFHTIMKSSIYVTCPLNMIFRENKDEIVMEMKMTLETPLIISLKCGNWIHSFVVVDFKFEY